MKKLILPFLLLLTLSACSRPWSFHFPPPFFSDEEAEMTDHSGAGDRKKESAGPRQNSSLFTRTPVPGSYTNTVRTPDSLDTLALPDIEPATLDIHDMPLPDFINELYGNILGLSFEISPQITGQKDLVTLRTTTPLGAGDLFRLTGRVLAGYGVGAEQIGGLIRFAPLREVGGQTPLIISGRALPDVPGEHRPVFLHVQLNVVKNTRVAGWIRMTYNDQKQLRIEEDTDRNAIILIGPPNLVAQAATAVNILDQPFMRGRHSLRIDPVNLDVNELNTALSNILTTEGYAVSNTPATGDSIILLPLEPIGAILAFATDEETLNHIRKWVIALDKPPLQQANSGGIFFYDVQNTTATRLAETINNLLGDKTGTYTPVFRSTRMESNTSAKNQTTASPKRETVASTLSGGTMVADEIRNSLVFKGDPGQWREILGLIRNFDRPSKQVLIEVTVAEIRLTDTLTKGVEFEQTGTARSLSNPDGTLLASTLGTLGLSTAGFNFTLESAGNTKALLNLFARDNRVNIISVPRILVKSGVEAKINVGTDVPTVTSSQSSSNGAFNTSTSSGVLQSIEYRSTGVLLTVKPVVFSGSRIDLEVTQEISDISTTTATTVNSPAILTRKIGTEVTLSDGGSILLGGLISTTRSEDTSGIPILKDIPLIGQLFRTDSSSTTKQMIVMLIVPYIVEDQKKAEALTEAMKKRLQEENDSHAGDRWWRPGKTPSASP